jgi:hypothetical protein
VSTAGGSWWSTELRGGGRLGRWRARGNPGPAGYGVVVTSPGDEVLAQLVEGIGWGTSNVAEYRGMIAGLIGRWRWGATGAGSGRLAAGGQPPAGAVDGEERGLAGPVGRDPPAGWPGRAGSPASTCRARATGGPTRSPTRRWTPKAGSSARPGVCREPEQPGGLGQPAHAVFAFHARESLAWSVQPGKWLVRRPPWFGAQPRVWAAASPVLRRQRGLV